MNDALYWIKTSGKLLEKRCTETSDKELVKVYIRDTVGEDYNVPTLGICKNLEAVQAFDFPERCVIKPTHMSGEVILRLNGEPLDLERIKGWFRSNFYDRWREQNYRDLEPKVIVEPLLFDRVDVDDLKVFCFRGEPKVIQVDMDRRTRHLRSLYSTEWELLPYTIAHPVARKVDPPANLSEMLSLATRLSEPFPFVRIDFYNDGKRIYVGEITHCHANASESFIPASGEWEFARRVFGKDGFCVPES
ncbi:MAG: hypothetical protein H6Q00_760 [Holophagaceae bacterium]|nr:hypothetical protein [Holophagaceae bacterium]